MTTARDIVTRSLRLIGVLGANEPGDSADLADSLSALNAYLEAWPLSTLTILTGQTTAFPLSSAYTYEIGPGKAFDTQRIASIAEGSFIRFQGIDTPLVQLDAAEYAGITTKFVPGRPLYFYYEPSAAGGVLTFYPGPSTGMELHLSANLPFEQFADLDTDYALPPGYLRALQYNLAVEMAPEYGKEPSQVVMRNAMTSIRQIKKSNSRVPILGMPAGLPGVWGGRGAYGGVLGAADFVYDIADQDGGFIQDQNG